MNTNRDGSAISVAPVVSSTTTTRENSNATVTPARFTGPRGASVSPRARVTTREMYISRAAAGPPETSLSTAPTRTRSSEGSDVQVVTANLSAPEERIVSQSSAAEATAGSCRSRRGRFAGTRAFGRGASARALSSRATLRLEARREASRWRSADAAGVMNAAGCDHARAEEASRLSFSIGADFERISVANASASSWSFARSASDAGSVGAISPGAGSRVMGSRRANASPLDGRGGGRRGQTREENERGRSGVGEAGTEGKESSPAPSLGFRWSVRARWGARDARSAG